MRPRTMEMTMTMKSDEPGEQRPERIQSEKQGRTENANYDGVSRANIHKKIQGLEGKRILSLV